MSCGREENLLKILLNKQVTKEYSREWLEVIRHEKADKEEESLSVLVFQLQQQWFALEAKAINAISEKTLVHTVPHRSNDYLEGVVNQGGRLKLAASFSSLLNLPKKQVGSFFAKEKMVTVQKGEEEWVFTVDEVVAIFSVPFQSIQNLPSTALNSFSNCLSGVFYFREKTVGMIDKDLLFAFLNSKALREFNV